MKERSSDPIVQWRPFWAGISDNISTSRFVNSWGHHREKEREGMNMGGVVWRVNYSSLVKTL